MSNIKKILLVSCMVFITTNLFAGIGLVNKWVKLNSSVEYPMFIGGTHRPKISDITEPRPQKSQYLQIELAGIGLFAQGPVYFFKARVIKKPEKNLYIKIEYENPLDKNNPFVVKDIEFKPDIPGFMITSYDFIFGLHGYKDYLISIFIYESKDSKKPIDVLKQKLRTYVDTRGLEPLVYDSVLPKNVIRKDGQIEKQGYFMNFEFDNRNWKLGNKVHTPKQVVTEWILENEKIENWSELVTETILFNETPIDVKKYVEVMQDLLSKGNKDFQTKILSEEKDDIIFEWSHKGGDKWPAQREIKRIIRTDNSIYQLSYVVLEEKYNESKYKQWLDIIRKATIKNKINKKVS